MSKTQRVIYTNNLNQKPNIAAKDDKFWAFVNTSDDEAELLLYGEIASSRPWWDWENEVVTQKQFIDDLKNLGDKKNITVRINSVGGEVFAAHAIYSQLKSNKANITVIVDGLAASAATIVAMAGDVVKMPSNAMMMIHNPMAALVGYYNADELEKMAADLEKIKESILAAYVAKTKMEKKELSKLMDKESWLTAEEALEYGFADAIMFDESINIANAGGNVVYINNVRHNLGKFSSTPSFGSKQNQQAPRAPEPKNVSEPSNKPKEIKNTPKEVTVMNFEELKAKHPELVAEIQNAAKEEGKKEERARIKDIEDISNSIPQDLVKKAKFEEPVNAEKLAFMALQNDGKLGKTYLNNAEADQKESGTSEVTATPQGQTSQQEKPATFQDKIKNVASKFDLARRGIKE